MPSASFNTTFSKEGIPACSCTHKLSCPGFKEVFLCLKTVFPNSKNPAENRSAGFFPSSFTIVVSFLLPTLYRDCRQDGAFEGELKLD
jgi:hypothetical protein